MHEDHPEISLEVELIIRPEVTPLLDELGVDATLLIAQLERVAGSETLRSQLPSLSEVCVTLMNDAEIHELNRAYREKDRPTDVLSFALQEGEVFITPEGVPTPLGDIMISVETALKQSRRGALPRLSSAILTEWGLSEELSFLALHGFLHLLGYDHEEDAEAEEMESTELSLLPTLLLRSLDS